MRTSFATAAPLCVPAKTGGKSQWMIDTCDGKRLYPSPSPSCPWWRRKELVGGPFKLCKQLSSKDTTSARTHPPLMVSIASSNEPTEIIGKTGPKISLNRHAESVISFKIVSPYNVLAHQGIVFGNISHNSWSNVSFFSIYLTTKDNLSLGFVHHLLNTCGVNRRNNPRVTIWFGKVTREVFSVTIPKLTSQYGVRREIEDVHRSKLRNESFLDFAKNQNVIWSYANLEHLIRK